jgi:hypothetical protein
VFRALQSETNVVIVWLNHVTGASPLDGVSGWTDEFACLALLGLAIILATYLVRKDEKDGNDNIGQGDTDRSSGK